MSKEESWNNFVPKTEGESSEEKERSEPLDPNDMSASKGKAEEQVWRGGAIHVVEGGEGGKTDIFTTMPKTGPNGEIAGPGTYEIVSGVPKEHTPQPEQVKEHGGVIESLELKDSLERLEKEITDIDLRIDNARQYGNIAEVTRLKDLREIKNKQIDELENNVGDSAN
jgi:hypothetical protein